MEEQNIGKINNSLWRAGSFIRGLVSEGQMQQIIIAFTFLRRIDCLIEQYAPESALFYTKNRERLSDERIDKELRSISGGYPFYNYSGYTFSNIFLSNISIEVVLNSYLQGFSKNVQEFLDGMYFRQNVAILQRQSRLLVDLFDTFSAIDMSIKSIDNEEFVELISSLLKNCSPTWGQFFTYQNLSSFICDCLLSKDIRHSKDEDVTIYDPVCGTGSMLANAGEKAKIIAIHQANIALFGQEISEFPCAMAKALTILTGNENSLVHHGNTLTDDLFSGKYFQYILADIPMGLQWRPIKERIENESFSSNGRFNIGLPSVSDSQFLFIQHIISKMDNQGSRAAFITNRLVLNNGDVKSGESRIRRWLFERDLVEAIIALPGGVLPHSNIPVYLWILNNRKDDSRFGRVQLINGSSKQLAGSKDFVFKHILDAYKHSYNDGIISKIINNQDFGFYELRLMEIGGPTRTVTIGLNTDINKYIKEEVTPFAKGEITVDYSSVEKGYSVVFEKHFKTRVEKDTNELNIEDLSNKVLSLIEEFRSFEIDSILNNYQGGNFAKEDTVQYGDTMQNVKPFYPLQFIAEISRGQGKEPDGELPYITVSYLRNKNVQSGIHLMKPLDRKNKIATDSDVLLINTGANAGEVFQGVSGIPSSTLSIIRANEDIVLPKYIYYLLKGNEKYLRNLTKGVSIKSIDLSTLSNAKFQLPSLEEQNQIVSLLDKMIEKIDKIIDLLGGTDNVLTQYRQALIENIIQGKLKI